MTLPERANYSLTESALSPFRLNQHKDNSRAPELIRWDQLRRILMISWPQIQLHCPASRSCIVSPHTLISRGVLTGEWPQVGHRPVFSAVRLARIFSRRSARLHSSPQKWR